MPVRCTAERLSSVQASVYYLHGMDREALCETAEAMLAAGAREITRLRLPHLVQGPIGPRLEAADGIPVGLAMANEQQGGHDSLR